MSASAASFANEFLVLASAHFLALLSPGPDFLLLLRSTSLHGARNGLGVSTGIACANALYIGCALAGITVVQESRFVRAVLTWLGCAYLIWLGYQFIKSSLSAPQLGLAGDGEERRGFVHGFSQGLLSGGLNPKNALFYLGLFSVSVGADTPWTVRALYGAWMFFVVWGWDTSFVAALRLRGTTALLTRHLRHVEMFAGLALLGLAILVALNRG